MTADSYEITWSNDLSPGRQFSASPEWVTPNTPQLQLTSIRASCWPPVAYPIAVTVTAWWTDGTSPYAYYNQQAHAWNFTIPANSGSAILNISPPYTLFSELTLGSTYSVQGPSQEASLTITAELRPPSGGWSVQVIDDWHPAPSLRRVG